MHQDVAKAKPVLPKRRRALRWTFRIVATIALSLLLLRWLHTTRVGIAVVDLVPDGFWDAYHRAFGFGQDGQVETLQDVDALVILVGTTVFAAMCVAFGEWCATPRRR
jgi:hypothetical protein